VAPHPSVRLRLRSEPLHILTKFLVILAAVLSVLLSGLAIAYTSNAERLVTEISVEKARASEAQALSAASAADLARVRESLEQKISALESELTQATQSYNELETENRRLLADNKRLDLKEATYEARIDDFSAQIDAFSKIVEDARTDVTRLQNEQLKSISKEIDLTDRINDLEGQLEVALETNRALQEQLVGLQDQVAQGGTGATIAARADGRDSVLRAPESLRARITDVQKDVDNSVMVSIDAGTNDLLKERMKVNIVRGNDWLASVVLVRVDLNESIGRVTLARATGGGAIEVGDLVLAADL
jgi:archaellum component FlaC